MKIEYLGNWCESIIICYLQGLRKNQETCWYLSWEDYGAELCSDFKGLSTTAEYKYYEDQEAMILLKRLYVLLKAYHNKKVSGNENLQEDPDWMEIQKVLQETEEKLRVFISQVREAENDIVVTQDILSGYVGAHLKSFAIALPGSIDCFNGMFEEFSEDWEYTKLHLDKDILESPLAQSITALCDKFDEIVKEEAIAIRPTRYAPITRWPELQLLALRIVS
jgi:hypothetical protein